MQRLKKEGKFYETNKCLWGGGNLKNKKNIVLSIALVVVLLVFVVGVTYAIAVFSTTSDANTVNTGRISMSYVEPTNALILENALPMSDEEGKAQTKYFEFTVSTHATTNADDSTGITIPYEINISDIAIDSDMTQLPKTAIKVNLVIVDNSAETEVISPKHLSRFVESTLRSGATIIYKTSDTHKNGSESITTTYRLRAWIDNDYVINNGDETKYQYKFRVNVNSQVNGVGVEYPEEEYLPEEGTLAYAILGENNSNIVTEGDGLYVSTETNDGEPTYYYKGNVENNYVSFANQTWRVVRINEDRSIRLIMENHIGNKYFNINNYDTKLSTYYSESNVDGGIMKTLNDWYNTNLSSYDTKIALSPFCETYTSNKTKFDCSLNEDGKQYVYVKIGLISAGELLMSGASHSTTSTNNSYIRNAQWTISSYLLQQGYGYVWCLGYGGYVGINKVNASMPVYPVISLNVDVTVTGTGASDNMWIVQ